MNLRKNIPHWLLFCSLSFIGSTWADNNTEQTIKIAKLNDAKVFASFTDKLPAVLNYFTSASQAEIIDFYKKAYGEVLSEELKRKRLTLTFKQENQAIRVVISSQNNKRQVDVLINQ